MDDGVIDRGTDRHLPQADRTPQLVSDPIVLDPEAASVTVDGRPVDLQPKQFALLHYLMRHAETVVATQTLLDEACADAEKTPSATLRVRINQLRTRLTAHGAPDVIRTVRGEGYRYDAHVEYRIAPTTPTPSTLPAAHSEPEAADAAVEPLRALSLGGVHLNLDGVQLRHGDARVELALNEFKLLHTLMANAGRVRSKRQVVDAVWGPQQRTTAILDDTLTRVRRRLVQVGLPATIIRTVVNAGYVFDTTTLPGHERSEG